MEELLKEMQKDVAICVACGFKRDEIIERLVAVFQNDYTGDDLNRKAEELVAAEYNKQLTIQSSWPEVTDCDRLTLAFDELNKNGIVARENFSCCGNCGCAEIGDEAGADTAEGYVFYHWQATENAVDGYGLYFDYGSFTENIEQYDQIAIEIGHRVVAALEAAGLEPEWDGALGKRIHLPLDWKKRLV